MMTREIRTLLDGLAFPEGPRWHDGRLWFSDMHRQQVMAVDLDGNAEVICRVVAKPSGLGWTTDGELLVVSMTDQRLLRFDGTAFGEVADLSGLASSHLNDMVVDGQGRAYIGNFGYDLWARAESKDAELILVEPGGAARVVADGLSFPNGAVITPDGRTLIVGETMAARLTAFDIAGDGSLSNRREWAPTTGAVPDGICLDAEDGIWIASPRSAEVVRVLEGGEVAERIAVETQAFACMLGGPAGRHLFICTASSSSPEESPRLLTGKIEVVEVDVVRAGWP